MTCHDCGREDDFSWDYDKETGTSQKFSIFDVRLCEFCELPICGDCRDERHGCGKISIEAPPSQTGKETHQWH
jgi:hypothetical protein